MVGCSTHKATSVDVQQELEKWIAKSSPEREPLEQLDFSKKPLTKTASENLTAILLRDKQNQLVNGFEKQWENREIIHNGISMPFYYQQFGDEPSDGRSLFISLHAG